MKKNNYTIFLYMLAASFFVMYGVMFLNVFDTSHIYLSLTRFYMTLLMVSPMAIMMLLFMPKMYQNKTKNITIIITSIAIFGLSLFALRTQTPIDDIQYMKAMIPHHSSAILTSENANLQDAEVKRLASDIIKAQEREIAEMKSLIKKLEQ